MNWHLQIADRARKALAKFPANDRRRILAALNAMESDPLGGDIKRLRGERSAWRRPAGSYRIFFDIDPESLTVEIVDITRRTSITY
jgi:mRNA-degrading endonuclease RelE of RelBE toxin-antitoxin system